MQHSKDKEIPKANDSIVKTKRHFLDVNNTQSHAQWKNDLFTKMYIYMFTANYNIENSRYVVKARI